LFLAAKQTSCIFQLKAVNPLCPSGRQASLRTVTFHTNLNALWMPGKKLQLLHQRSQQMHACTARSFSGAPGARSFVSPRLPLAPCRLRLASGISMVPDGVMTRPPLQFACPRELLPTSKPLTRAAAPSLCVADRAPATQPKRPPPTQRNTPLRSPTAHRHSRSPRRRSPQRKHSPCRRPSPSLHREPSPVQSSALDSDTLTGTITSYDQTQGYGFLRCSMFEKEDIFFHRSSLPGEAQTLGRRSLAGCEVTFELSTNVHGKKRALGLAFAASAPSMNKIIGGSGRASPACQPNLDDVQVEAIAYFLEKRGGWAEWSTVRQAFPHVNRKRISEAGLFDFQRLAGLEVLAVPGTSIPTCEPAPDFVTLSRSTRLLGQVMDWDGSVGKIETEGIEQSIIFKATDLPREYAPRETLSGAWVTFELKIRPSFKAAGSIHFLAVPHQGGFVLRGLTDTDSDLLPCRKKSLHLVKWRSQP
jgi:cold shock CspA family protein